MFPFFARPCPVRPRHGFVDSRLVSSKKEWLALIRETLEADAEAEIVCMPFIDAKWSAVLTPSGLTVGPGHDGATAGHGSLAIPAGAITRTHFERAFQLDSCNESIHDSPYVELVCDGRHIEVVQLRDGPSIRLSDAYIPAAVRVGHVVVAEGDLLEWEERSRSFPPGTVVYHPGGSLSSHYAVHCIVNGVPVICSREPVVGEVLEPSGPSPLTPDDYARLAEYVVAYDGLMGSMVDEERAFAPAASIAIAALHAQGQWGNEDHLLRLRGFGAVTILRLCLMAVHGELRHYYTSGPGRSGIRSLTKTIAARSRGRSEVYVEAVAQPLRALLANLRTAEEDFSARGWDGSCGGKMWANCTALTRRLAEGLAKFVADPAAHTWAPVVEAWNSVINAAHNNGLFLNKFASPMVFDQAAVVPSVGFANASLGRILFGPAPTASRRRARAWQNALGSRTRVERRVSTHRARYFFVSDLLHVHVSCEPFTETWGFTFTGAAARLSHDERALLRSKRADYRDDFDGLLDAVDATAEIGTGFYLLVDGHRIRLRPNEVISRRRRE